jgi:hypothetical protein
LLDKYIKCKEKHNESELVMKESRGNLKTNTLKGKLTNNIIRWYGHVSRKNVERNPEKVLNMQMKGKHSRGRPRTR